MQTIRCIFYLLAAWLVFVPAVHAAVVPDLYTALVTVDDRGADALDAGAQAALAQVLVKASGSDELLNHAEIAQALRAARSKVLTYAYVSDGADGLPRVRIEFDANYVTELVRDAGAPLWTANRPPVLAWVVVQEDNWRRFLNAETDSALVDELQAAFSRRGVLLQLPLHDLTDAAALRAADVWQYNGAAISAASERYDVDDVAVARVRLQPDDQLRVDWRYYYQTSRGDTAQLSASGRSGPGAMAFAAGADLVADSMASRYAVAPSSGEPGTVYMLVSGVFEYADYAALIRWVRSLEPIGMADVERVQGDRLTLRLATRAHPDSLRNIIELNERLIRASDEVDPTLLRYRWR